MKARIDCSSCRKRIHQEEHDACLKAEYAIFRDMALSFAAYSISAALMTMVRRGRSRQYIQKLYEDMCFVFETPEVLGKEVMMSDIMKLLEEDYGIDWDKIHVNVESEKQFIGATKRAEKERKK